ncbi:unnamed protein product [Meganyctiphanes norvegica]|uniref:Uncharacterized protein n=1 Tax=Meganyctiphanes norvegica TaxID=48144 RepID=A0AAV2RFX7_MEGNR
MSKLEKHQMLLDQLEPTIEKCIQELDIDSEEKSEKARKNIVAGLKADSTMLQKFIDTIRTEEFGKEAQKDAVALEIRGINLVRKIAIAASDVKESIETKSKVAGKLAKLDLPTFDGDFLLYKYFRTRFTTLTEGCNETTKRYI